MSKRIPERATKLDKSIEVNEKLIALLERKVWLPEPDREGWWAFAGSEWQSKPIFKYRDTEEFDEDDYDQQYDCHWSKPEIVRYETVKGEPFRKIFLVREVKPNEAYWERGGSGPYEGPPILGFRWTNHAFYTGMNGFDKLTGQWLYLDIAWPEVTNVET